MSFINSLLLDRVAYGFTGGPTWMTTKVMLRSGRVRRNAERSVPLHRYTLPYQNLQPEHRADVIEAFNACRGSLHSFRFFDRNDYQLDAVNIGTADGTTDQEIQLIKPYTFGGTTVNRTITKPVDSTVDYGRGTNRLGSAPAFVITAENPSASPVTATPISFTMDYSTGIVTLTSTNGYVIRATGWFDVPVYFEHDELQFSTNELDAHTTDIDLVEDLGA